MSPFGLDKWLFSPSAAVGAGVFCFLSVIERYAHGILFQRFFYFILFLLLGVSVWQEVDYIWGSSKSLPNLLIFQKTNVNNSSFHTFISLPILHFNQSIPNQSRAITVRLGSKLDPGLMKVYANSTVQVGQAINGSCLSRPAEIKSE